MRRVPTTHPLHAALAMALVAAVGLAACGKKEAEPAPAKAEAIPTPSTPSATPTDREIRITELKPADATFRPGETAKLHVAIAFTLPADGGTVGIVVQDGNGKPVTNRLVPVPGGSGTLTDEIEFVVPATNRVTLHVPLYVKGESRSATVATSQFAVGAN